MLEGGYGRIEYADDYLRDEDSAPSPTYIKFLTNRAKARGRNFIAFTGGVTPWELSNYENSFTNEYSELDSQLQYSPTVDSVAWNNGNSELLEQRIAIAKTDNWPFDQRMCSR